MRNECLKIDVDPGYKVYSVKHMQRLLIRAGYHMTACLRERSISGKGWHVYVYVQPEVRTNMEVVALQAILGSDRYREACNVLRVRTIEAMPVKLRKFWGPRWNVFYSKWARPDRGQGGIILNTEEVKTGGQKETRPARQGRGHRAGARTR